MDKFIKKQIRNILCRLRKLEASVNEGSSGGSVIGAAWDSSADPPQDGEFLGTDNGYIILPTPTDTWTKVYREVVTKSQNTFTLPFNATNEQFVEVLYVGVNGVGQNFGASTLGYSISGNVVTITETLPIDSATPDYVEILYTVKTI